MNWQTRLAWWVVVVVVATILVWGYLHYYEVHSGGVSQVK